MRNSDYSSTNEKNWNVTYKGPLESMKGNHNNMPARTEAYLPGDERGHVNASSLGGVNTKDNIVAQHRDVNHGAYYSIEKGERAALQNGATIESEKTAVVNSQPGDRPTTFEVNDTVTYANRLVCEKAEMFEQQYRVIERDIAIEVLENNGIIVNNCLVIEDKHIPIENCLIVFFCKALSGAYYFRLGFFDKYNGELLQLLDLDDCLCTYFSDAENIIVNWSLFDLFLTNKSKFIELLLRYNDEVKMEKHIE